MVHEWHPQTALEVIGFLALLAIFFVVLWCLVCFLLALLGGWRRLAESYRLDGVFEGARWYMRSGRMRWGVNYNGCLTLGANGRGLYLAVMVLFRAAQPPLFIPWSDVGCLEQKGLLFKYVVFSFLRAPGVTLRLPRPLGVSLLQAGGREPSTMREVVA